MTSTSSWPDLATVLGGLRVVAVPMRVRFRGVTLREVALLEGPSGWGEFGAFPEYEPPEAARWLTSALLSAYAAWPAPVRDVVPVNATVPAVEPGEVAGVVARFDGCTTAKVKVAEIGQAIDDDVARVAEVRAVMGPQARIRVDANGAWDVDTARSALGRLAAYGIEYAEQPCATVEALRDLRLALARDRVEVPVAADESIRRAEDPLRVARLEAADVVVVKVAPLGGVSRALEVVEGCGLPAVVSSALDTSVGMAAGVALAAALPELPYACGLGTVALLDGDTATPSLTARGGLLAPGRVTADAALLERYAAAGERVRWWRDRVTRCWECVRWP